MLQGEQKTVSDLPTGARSALETLRLQRLQKQGASDASLPNSSGPAPVQSTLPSNEHSNESAPMQDILPRPSSSPQDDADKLSAPIQDTLADSVQGLRYHAALSANELSNQTVDADKSAPMQDTLADRPGDMPAQHPRDSSKIISLQPTESKQKHTQSGTHATVEAAPVADTLGASQSANGQVSDEDDDLIRQAMTATADEDAAGPSGVVDEDSELLQQLLAGSQP